MSRAGDRLIASGMQARRAGKMLAQVEATKAAQAQGKRVMWFTNDQAKTAETLSKHGALSELVGEAAVIPHFKKSKY